MIQMIIADESHTAIVAELLHNLFDEVGHTVTYDDIIEYFEDIDSDDFHSTVLAMNDDDEAVGVITLVETISLYAGGKIGVINELYVVPPYRSDGVGKMLVDAAKEIAEERDWKRIEVTTPGDEYHKTLRFYEREGFHKIGPRYRWQM